MVVRMQQAGEGAAQAAAPSLVRMAVGVIVPVDVTRVTVVVPVMAGSGGAHNA